MNNTTANTDYYLDLTRRGSTANRDPNSGPDRAGIVGAGARTTPRTSARRGLRAGTGRRRSPTCSARPTCRKPQTFCSTPVRRPCPLHPPPSRHTRRGAAIPIQQEFYFIITLEDVFVSSYSTGGSAGDIWPPDRFSLAFGKISIDYLQQDKGKGHDLGRCKALGTCGQTRRGLSPGRPAPRHPWPRGPMGTGETRP